MENCYKVLGVPVNATAAEIRKAYRRLAKELHPDASRDEGTTDAFRRITEAYKILSNARERAIFDESFFTRHHTRRSNVAYFDYRTWLLAREDEESRAKLIFFDLMHHREDDAVAEFKRMTTNCADFSLKRWFTREDFMDYGYILAEELVLRSEYYDAVLLLEQIIRMEYSFSYFRLFFPEVLQFTKDILKHNIEGCISDELALDVWERALDLGFGKADDVFFLKKMSAAYQRIGDPATAAICLAEAARIGG